MLVRAMARSCKAEFSPTNSGIQSLINLLIWRSGLNPDHPRFRKNSLPSAKRIPGHFEFGRPIGGFEQHSTTHKNSSYCDIAVPSRDDLSLSSVATSTMD